MKFIQGQDRTQINLFPVSLDQTIDSENEVRIIDLFVDSLSIKDYGFRMDFIENGRSAYHPADLLKLFIYVYMNKIRKLPGTFTGANMQNIMRSIAETMRRRKNS